jgi:hypothetical protein
MGTPSAERLEPSLARELTREANDTLAAAISKHPDRFGAFKHWPEELVVKVTPVDLAIYQCAREAQVAHGALEFAGCSRGVEHR